MSDVTRRQALKMGAAGASGALLPGAWTAVAQADSVAPPQVLAAGDLALWYDEGAGTDWLRALPIGNGRLGGMVFGNVDAERLQLNEDTVWAGSPHDPSNTRGLAALPEIRRLVFANQWTQAQNLINQNMLGNPGGQLAYQTVGNLRMAFPSGSASQYHRQLDLTTATTTVSYVMNGVRYHRETFASAPDQIIAMRLTADRTGSISFTATFDSPQRTTSSSPDGATIALDGVSGNQEGITGAVRFHALASAVISGGSVTSSAGTLRVTNATSVTLLVSIGSSYVNYRNVGGDYQGIARRHLSAARTVSYDQLRSRHVADYQALFGRVSLELGRTSAADQTTDVRIAQHNSVSDPQFSALLFQFGRYLLISSSRPGTQPANLQGIWNDSLTPSWDSKYTINANLPMNYWLANTTNLSECHGPVFDMVRDLAVAGARTAQVQYGAGGWVTHHNTDAWRATSVVDGAFWGMWQTGGAWLATLIWDHYLFTGDIEFLRTNYPAMKGAAQFFLDTLVTEPSLGYLVTNPSNSPEIGHHADASVCAGPTMDNQILRDLFDGCARASEILSVDTTFRAQVRATRDRLAPMRVGSRGNIMEWLYDWVEPERTHRHISHLYGLAPSNQITRRGTPQLFEAARRTLEIRGDDGTGWSLAWKINFWARMEEGNRAHDLIRYLATPARLAPNMFDLHPPFQIDGNFGATAGIAEMLLQSHAGELHILPALPGAWPTGQVSGLRARGGYTVGIAWSSSQAAEVVVRADRAGIVRLRGRLFAGNHSVVDAADGTPATTRRLETDLVEVTVQAGRTYRATPTGASTGPTLEQSFSNASTTNDSNTGVGNFDGNGATLSAQALAQAGVTPGATVSRNGVNFRWPNVAPGGADNAIASGQSISLAGTGRTLGFLATGTYGAVSGTAAVVYADGARQTFTLSTPDWYGGPHSGGTAAIVTQYQNRPNNQRQNTAACIYYVGVTLQNKAVARVELPNISARPAAGVPTMHVFAIAIGG
ncbi:alpha-L-fucosidase 2 [Micromonospora phaseoli]|uniref:Alpha-L-fucosidase 2 n=1 Tax=Micromonospora phaseoli TaxID=1144548 RepID=A0A1H6UWL9_9ACTN|nr:glycoside hydrolase family 95 protein [Micromonospora phaseoli]PZV93841.1 alpha-L-fucosidase 2 [Micromonospora phaseoli]GIJ80716.1 large protein [Micromonospora phaseoli]SEI96056.1 alpha-L-fucosidase 2 [Micromonospora phaseoli]